MRAMLPVLILNSLALVHAQDDGTFESRIKLLLSERCVQCHGGGTTASGFDLTNRASMLAGGKHGIDVVPGKPEESRLYQWISEGKMPPGRKLDGTEIAVIREWIEAGAAWGTSGSIRADRPRAGLDWWSLESPRRAEPPRVDGSAHPIDAFVLVRLREKGLDFAPLADSRTLLRRLTFGLHGLPPKSEHRNEPYESAIERLLAAPEYGERWGRHWLDIVRFWRDRRRRAQQ